MLASRKAKIFLATSFCIALVSALAFGALAWRDTRSPSGPAARVTLSDAPYKPTAPDVPTVKTELWSQPGAQSRGRDWVYDTFTPPEIFYNARSKHFTVNPPLGMGDAVPEEPFGLELVAVRPEPFRLQLIGYVGTDGDWRGTFQNVATGEVFLASAGYRVDKLALRIISLDVHPVDIALPKSMTTRQRVATAVIQDERAKREVTLTHRERQFTGGLSAFVALPGETAAREVRERETFRIGDASYHIEKIQLAPPNIDVTKESPALAQPDHRTLTPRESDDSAPPSDPPA